MHGCDELIVHLLNNFGFSGSYLQIYLPFLFLGWDKDLGGPIVGNSNSQNDLDNYVKDPSVKRRAVI